MKQELNVAVFQMTSTNDFDYNIQQFWNLINQLENPRKVDIIATPENTFYLRLAKTEKPQSITLKHKIFQELSEFAQRNETLIHLGSVSLRVENEIFNATVIITPEGKVFSPYQKIHLFDIQLEGQEAINESDIFEAGKESAIFDFDGWKMGMSICYDLRFGELFTMYKGVDLIMVPSAFLVPTGKAHWEILLRARAIENQCYVIAAAQGGDHGLGRKTYGHSMVVDPWGNILGQVLSDEKPSVIECVIDKRQIKKVKTQIPMHLHRKL